ncbi:hypothetical protein PM082_009255 [Marasmius tenuissimus]|nr:hypothetical protein PM082_009255 [Marasmius tenuissimus]
MSQLALSSYSEAYVGRDHNANYGSGNFTVNNQVLQQRRPIDWEICGTKEEEKVYGQYSEYRHGDIQIIGPIYSERVKKFDWSVGRYVPFDCERSIVLGKIVSGEGMGTIVTVEAYEGRDAAEVCILAF